MSTGYANANMNAHVQAARGGDVVSLFFSLLATRRHKLFCTLRNISVSFSRTFQIVQHNRRTHTHTQWTHTSATLAEICK